MSHIRGIERVKSTRIIGSRHSVPPHMTQPYVTLYMLRKQKERLEKEGTRLDTRRGQIVEQLEEIDKESKRLERRDKRVQKKKGFDPDPVWVKGKSETQPEELNRSNSGAGWKITTLKKRR
ncbi:MAG: hypothetical protein WCE90_07990 [Candidatus Zixiibacteriota bacterium]